MSPQDPPDDILVDQGSFRIDRNRALEKLMRFQLPDARMYPLPWIQAAVAGSAKRIHISALPAGFELAFDGVPWTPAELADPYRHLFEEDLSGDKARNRELGIGLLSVLRLKPSHVSLMFAHEGKECILTVSSLTMEKLDTRPGRPLADQQDRYGDPIAMSIFVGLQDSFAKELEHIEKFCRHCPIPISVAKKTLSWPGDSPGPGASGEPALERRFSQDGAQGRLSLTRETLAASRVEFVTHGVTIADETLMLPGLQGAGLVRDDALRKSLSQMGIVKEERYQNTLRALEAASLELLKESVSRAIALAPRVGGLLWDGNLRPLWLPWVGHSMKERLNSMIVTAASQLPGEEFDRNAVLNHSLIVGALREACYHHRIEMLKRAGGTPELLWDAPVLFDLGGRPLSLRALEMQRRWLGHVPYSDSPSKSPPGTLAVAWTLRDPDRLFIEEFFPGEARRVAGERVDAPPAVRPTLEDQNILIKAPIEDGGARGEIAWLYPKNTVKVLRNPQFGPLTNRVFGVK